MNDEAKWLVGAVRAGLCASLATLVVGCYDSGCELSLTCPAEPGADAGSDAGGAISEAETDDDVDIPDLTIPPRPTSRADGGVLRDGGIDGDSTEDEDASAEGTGDGEADGGAADGDASVDGNLPNDGTTAGDDGGMPDSGADEPVDAGTACDGARNPCDENATCTNPADGGLTPMCECNAPYLGDGETCWLPHSCAELLDAMPDAENGTYAIATGEGGGADGGEPVTVDVFCEMETAGGGWMESVNSGTSFDPADPEAYLGGAMIPMINLDMMIDFSAVPMTGPGDYDVRVAFLPVDDGWAFEGRTFEQALTGPSSTLSLNVDDRSNQELWFGMSGATAVAPAGGTMEQNCETATATALWPALTTALCEVSAPNLELLDNHVTAECAGTMFIVGISGANCTGWPQAIGTDYPEYVRIWVR